MNRKWTQEQIELLKRLYPENDNDYVATRIGLSPKAIKNKAIKLKLKKTYGHHHFTEENVAYIKANFANTLSSVIAEKIGCTLRGLYNKAHALGLKKSKEWLCSEESGRLYKGNQKGYNTRFKKGKPTWNKGMTGLSYEASKATQFKKGNIPHNHKPIGSERITKDGYIEIKISEPNKWEQLHRVLWKQSHGEIPYGYCVVFKDGNKKNCVIENLELISRAENAIRNRHKSWKQYTEELKTTIRALATLKRRINNAKKQNSGFERPSV